MKLSLPANISKLRKERSMTQEQLAEALGVTFASVSKWERGVARPELDLLTEMADFFGVSVDTLIGHKLCADRMDALIAQIEKAVDDRDEETALMLCEMILRNYPNNSRAVETCVDGYYNLYIYTVNRLYMERCIEQTKRLMSLKEGESERERLERIHYLGNQYDHLEQWDTAKKYYEQSNVSGTSDPSIANCLLKMGKPHEAVTMLSNSLVENMFTQFQIINILADGWVALGETEKACSALEWLYTVMESIHYDPTTMILLKLKLAGHYNELGQIKSAEDAIRSATILAKENSERKLGAKADFLQIDSNKKMRISASGDNKEMLIGFAAAIGPAFVSIVNEELQSI